MIGTRYTEELIKEYVTKGFWDPVLLKSDLCDKCAKDYPDKEAVADRRSRIAWRQVKEQSDRIARGLADLGFKKDDVIVVQVPNCVELFLLFFGCEKAGVIMATAQPTFRQAEMEPILRQTQAKGMVITRNFRDFDYFGMVEELRPNLPELKHIIVVGDDIPQGAVSLKELMMRQLENKFSTKYFQRVRFKPYEVVRLFNTSGTTGVPKCIERPAAPYILSGKQLIKRFQLNSEDTIGIFFHMGAGIVCILSQTSAPLLGAKLVLLDHFTPQAACELVQKEKVTVLCMVPAEIAMLIDYPELAKYDLRSLRMVVTGTQLLPYQLGMRAEEKLRCPVVIAYGSGDTSMIAATPLDATREFRLGTVGPPLEGNEVKIVDDNGNPLPKGEVGDVCVRGANMVSGYYRNPELTRKTWLDGWFNLGDAGRIDEEERIVLLGRKRDVIKRGGQAIFPSEIENMLLEHPKVSNVAIVAMPDPVMVQKQCAFAIPKPGQTFTFEEMISFLKSKKIASYKLPERLEIVSQFPRVPGGQKVDKIRLEAEITRKIKEENEKTD